MTLEDVDILSDGQVRGIYYDVYNGLWRRYRDHVPAWESPEWENIVEHEKRLRAKYGNCPMVLHMVQDVMDQLEARSRKGKTR